MPSCVVYKCGMSTARKLKEKDANLRFFSFPRDEKMQRKWLTAINRQNINIKNARVCSRHFDEKCYRKDWRTEMYNYRPATARVLLPDAVPIHNLVPIPIPQKSAEVPPSPTIENSESPESVESKRRRLDSASLQEDLKRLTEENKRLREELKQSKSKEQYELLEDACLRLSEKLRTCVPKSEVVKHLRRMFTPGQIRAILLPQRRKIQWTSEDISAAVTLRSISARAYEYLKSERNVPLPGQSTLRKWLGSVKLERGKLSSVLRLMEQKGASMKEEERLAVLSFGGTEKREGACHCVVLRGLFGRWKQPVYFTEEGFGKDHLLELIDDLHGVGFIVTSIVSNAEENPEILRELGVGVGENEKCFFVRGEGMKVFVFADASCLFGGIKRCFLDDGFVLNGRAITKDCVERVFVERGRKFEALSRGVGEEIQAAGDAGGLDDYNWAETVEFISIINDWFQVFSGDGDFGDLEEQVTKLERMTLLMREQEGSSHLRRSVILNNRSLPQMFKYVRENYSTESFRIDGVNTKRLSVGVLNQLFSYLKSGRGSDNWSTLDFKCRLRWYIFGDGRRLANDASCDFLYDGDDGDEDREEILVRDLFEFKRKSLRSKRRKSVMKT